MSGRSRRPTGKIRPSRVRRLGRKDAWTDGTAVIPPAEHADHAALVAMIRTIARVFDHTSLDTLRHAHIDVGRSFLDLVESTRPGDLTNAAEQRVLGILWAELEEAIDRRSQGH